MRGSANQNGAGRDETTLVGVARSALGQAVLAALRTATLRVALAVGGADPSLGEAQVQTPLNLSASHVAARRLYDGGLSLPSKLPWPQAKALVAALLDALGNARLKALGYEMSRALVATGERAATATEMPTARPTYRSSSLPSRPR